MCPPRKDTNNVSHYLMTKKRWGHWDYFLRNTINVTVNENKCHVQLQTKTK